MLTQKKSVFYLIDQQLLSPEVIVNDQIKVTFTPRRNRNVCVISNASSSYFIKQGQETKGLGTITNEAAIYQVLKKMQQSHLQAYLPACVHYDESAKILVLEYIPDAQDLRAYHLKRGQFPKSIGHQIGTILGLLHHLTLMNPDEGNSSLPLVTPWVLSLHHPELNLFRTISKVGLRLIKIMQQFPEFGEKLDQLRLDWCPDTLIHSDIKFENFIAYPGPRSRRQLKLIDWEFAGQGDPCWDVGSVLSSYLCFWLTSIPITGEKPPDQFVTLARYPLVNMQGAIAAFWDAYIQQMQLDPVMAEIYLLRSIQFGAARLVQTAYEMALSANQLTSTMICLLQLSLNILQRPEDAITELLGIQSQELHHD